jgi:hypothetical protein
MASTKPGLTGCVQTKQGDQMFQMKAVEAMAEAHRRDLAAFSPGRKGSSHAQREVVPAATSVTTQRAAAQFRTAGSQMGHKPIVHHVGAWLIRAGTRMGGTSIRTS